MRDVLREVVLLDEAVGPDAPHQLLFADAAAALLDERDERLERLRRELHGAPLAQQRPFARVQREGAEGVRPPAVVLGHQPCAPVAFTTVSEKFSEAPTAAFRRMRRRSGQSPRGNGWVPLP